MQRKLAGIESIVAGIRKAFGRMKGGAGAVAAAIAVCLVLGCVICPAAGNETNASNPYDEIPTDPIPDFGDEPFSKPPADKVNYNGALPSRLPC